MPEQKIPLLVVAGPTAVGKTALAIELARRLQGEIISADSMQVYRYLDIGTAKPTTPERAAVPHHLIDVVYPDERFTVFDYQERARAAILGIHERGKLPIMTGGTGLYIKAVLEDYAFSQSPANQEIRKALQRESRLQGNAALDARLQAVDPEAAKRIHANDTRRLIRALEYYLATGEPISRQWERTRRQDSPYRPVRVGLYMSRTDLYERIEKRAESMIAAGLLEEVRGLLASGYSSDLKPLQSLGYRHMLNYLEKKWDWEQAVLLFKRDTRKYAKRQITWFRADPQITWYELRPGKQIDPVLETICSQLEG